ncbi:DUF4126 domain-containing protein [Cellulomonas timonensis]|uniref:DUF4126 domain-containing protein n=1 Tax=Cellulomonas timonensis TaxID=1689271 RepID=UPI0009EE5161|nr:DUF4126 domain-containing protein [Cellulomonas timonensis]
MFEILAGTGLAAAAGLNAYVPLLALGALARWTDLISTPAGWEWLTDGWVLTVLGVLLLLEVVADKIPGVDHVNDIVQTIVRPGAGGIAFGAGVGTQDPGAAHTVVTDPAAFVSSGQWAPVLVGVLLALAVHAAKALLRPVVNAATFGLGAPVLSAAEDATSVTLSLAALLAPLLVVGVLIVVGAVWWRWRRGRRRGPAAPADAVSAQVRQRGGRTRPPLADTENAKEGTS